MSRYIDADALRQSIETDRNKQGMPKMWNLGVVFAITHILGQPTADVVERRENPIDAEEVYWNFKDVDGHQNLVIRLKGMVTDVTDIRIRLDKYSLKEIVRGEWLLNDSFGFKIYDCSNCGVHMEAMFNFCPFCGAEMKNGEKHEQIH